MGVHYLHIADYIKKNTASAVQDGSFSSCVPALQELAGSKDKTMECLGLHYL